MGTLVAGIVLTDAAALRGDACAAVERMRSTVAALTDDVGALPDAAVRLAALALSAVADRAAELPSAGDESGARRWADAASELVEPARATAHRGKGGTPQGPEGMAWLARAEAEWTRAVSGTDTAAWARAVAAFDYGDEYEWARCRLRYAEALLAADDRRTAAAEAAAARQTAARLGAKPLFDRLDALIRRGRLRDAAADVRRAPPAAPPRSPPARWTSCASSPWAAATGRSARRCTSR